MMCDPTGRTWWIRARNRIATPSHRPDNDSNESEGRSGRRTSSDCGELGERKKPTDALLRHVQGKITVVVLEWILMKTMAIRTRVIL